MISYISITRFWAPYIPITPSSAYRTYLSIKPCGILAGIALLFLRNFYFFGYFRTSIFDFREFVSKVLDSSVIFSYSGFFF